jgi:hypothetical protein
MRDAPRRMVTLTFSWHLRDMLLYHILEEIPAQYWRVPRQDYYHD